MLKTDILMGSDEINSILRGLVHKLQECIGAWDDVAFIGKALTSLLM